MSVIHMRNLFTDDPLRFSRYSIEAASVFLDYSKNRINDQTLGLLFDLARQQSLPSKIDQLFSGAPLNNTERRAASHVALRYRGDQGMLVAGSDVMPKVRQVLDQMRDFTNGVRSGEIKGASGKRFNRVINVGIGGSDLGPRMVAESLRDYADGALKVRFVSNVDADDMIRALKGCSPETTLFIVTSKTFTTQETLANAALARDWLVKGLGEAAVEKHFVAVSAHPQRAAEFGISEASVFDFWDWVGGRYSLWSAVGLPVALLLGMKNMEALLSGAYQMDEHFRNAPLEENIPVILAMLGVWYNNFLDSPSHAILPYDERLKRFVPYVQQLDMESNGKTVSREGNTITYPTGPVIWGDVGTNSQHAFFQLLHQGSHPVSSDFIAAKEPHHPFDKNHKLLIANFIAQTEALMKGRSQSSAAKELNKLGVPPEEITRLAPHKHFAGNRPSNSILLDKLTPQSLGALMAMYEHKVFVQGVIWDVNSFDQWGVELGKQLAKTVLADLNGSKSAKHDSSTSGLIQRLKD
jgi:glucose-6-phosphate isomerase